ncbi:unnamed protein product [Meloidogyne enterolobii]|uniref:Uncharacterized protein n=1 Tax=Meloidogyne enterolobii TaxID=390850 RepID=A0ACB1ABP2_MELEN
METSRIKNQNQRFFQHPSFYELEKKRRQMSEERLKSYSHNTHSAVLRRTKSGNDVDILSQNHRRLMSQKPFHVHSHILPTAKLQNSKSTEESNPWYENNRKLKEGLSSYSYGDAYQNFKVPRSETTLNWNDFRHGLS